MKIRAMPCFNVTPLWSVILTRSRNFFVSRNQQKRMVLCCHCASTMLDSHVELHTHLKAPKGPYSIVLPICKACLDSGCHIIVRHARQNATAKQAKLDAERARGTLRQERATTSSAKDASNGVAPSVVAGGEEEQVAEEVEEERATAPRRSRRNTRNASPRYVEPKYC